MKIHAYLIQERDALSTHITHLIECQRADVTPDDTYANVWNNKNGTWVITVGGLSIQMGDDLRRKLTDALRKVADDE